MKVKWRKSRRRGEREGENEELRERGRERKRGGRLTMRDRGKEEQNNKIIIHVSTLEA